MLDGPARVSHDERKFFEVLVQLHLADRKDETTVLATDNVTPLLLHVQNTSTCGQLPPSGTRKTMV